MDQSRIAGIGNLLADEILWQAKLHPRAAANGLDQTAAERLHATLRGATKKAAKHGRVPRRSGWLTAVRDDPDPTCPPCGAKLERSTVAVRTTLLCPKEQR